MNLMKRPRLKLKVQEAPSASEYQECKAFWQWAQLQPVLCDYLIKIANENQSQPWFLRALYLIGMRPGLPDYFLPIANQQWNGLWIEMKKKDKKKHKKNEKQEIWIEKLLKIDHYATYAYGCDDAIRICTHYLVNDTSHV